MICFKIYPKPSSTRMINTKSGKTLFQFTMAALAGLLWTSDELVTLAKILQDISEWWQGWICKNLVTYSFVKYWNKTDINYWKTTNHTFPLFPVLFPDIPVYSLGLLSWKSMYRKINSHTCLKWIPSISS